MPTRQARNEGSGHIPLKVPNVEFNLDVGVHHIQGMH